MTFIVCHFLFLLLESLFHVFAYYDKRRNVPLVKTNRSAVLLIKWRVEKLWDRWLLDHWTEVWYYLPRGRLERCHFKRQMLWAQQRWSEYNFWWLITLYKLCSRILPFILSLAASIASLQREHNRRVNTGCFRFLSTTCMALFTYFHYM